MALWRKLISSSLPAVTEQDEHSPSVQLSSVAQSCPKLCDTMDCSTPGFPVHHQLLELVQPHVHQVSDPIQPSHSLSSLSPLAFNLCWLKVKKFVLLKCYLFLSYTKAMNHFLIRLWHAPKSGFYTTTGNGQFSGWTKKKLESTSQSQTCTPPKRSWSLFGGLLPIRSTTAFWILVKPLHLRSTLSKSMRCTQNCNACSWQWSTERAWLLSTMTPDHTSHNQHFKSRMNWALKFCLFHHSHLTSCQLTTTSSSILRTFCRENASITSRMQKMLSKGSSNPKAQGFML